MNTKYVMAGLLAAALAVATLQLKREEPLPMLPATEPAALSQNYILQDSKLVPLTVLSEADAKKPCTECHEFK